MRFIAIFAAFAVWAVAAPAAYAADPIVVKFSHVVAENTPKGRMANKLKELVDEKLGGKVLVEVYPNAQLYGDNKVLEAMLLGDVQLAAPALSKFQKYTKSLQLFDLPFLFKDIESVDRFQASDAGQQLLTSMESKGVTGLGYLHNGMKQLSASKPIRVPADIDGLKFRIMTSDVLAAQFQAVDALPIKKPFSEVFTLLQTKAIDGQENTYSNIFSKKFFEVQPYITESNHGLLDYLVVTSTEFWTELPDDVRGDFKAALDEAVTYGNEIANQLNSEQKQLIVDSRRSEILTLTDAERQQWVDAMKPVWKEFEDDIGKELIDSAAASNTAS
jgi:C4-dicarboxylate-binding protein DctP